MYIPEDEILWIIINITYRRQNKRPLGISWYIFLYYPYALAILYRHECP